MEFEPFDRFPKIYSKHARTLLIPDFSKIEGRNPEKDEEKLALNNQKQDIEPNKDYSLKPLDTGIRNWHKSLSREQNNIRFLKESENPYKYKPDLLQYHDKTIKARDVIRQTFEKNYYSPNLRFDNSPPRDNKMYQLSDLSNLDN